MKKVKKKKKTKPAPFIDVALKHHTYKMTIRMVETKLPKFVSRLLLQKDIVGNVI